MLDTIIVNKKKLDWLVVERGFNIPSFNFITEREKVNGRAGSVRKSRNIEELEFELPLIVRNDYLSPGGKKSHDEILKKLVDFFKYDEAVELRFKSQSWFWKAYFDGPIELPKNPREFIKFTIKVVLLDPFKYSTNEYENTAISDEVVIVNKGTADTPVTIEARALKNAPYYMITKNDEDYFKVGVDDVNEVAKDYSPNILSDEFRTTTGWTKTTSGNISDTLFGGIVGGTYKIEKNGEGFEVSTFPSGSGWIGSQYKKAFSRQAQDFKVTVKAIIYQSNRGAGKVAYHLYDTDNRILASLGYINTSPGNPNGKFVITLFNQSGGESKVLEARNVPFVNKMKTLIVYMSIERVGQLIKLKTWLFDHNKDPNRIKPLQIVNKSVTDSGNFYQRPVSSIGVYQAKSTTINNYMKMHALGAYVSEKLPKKTGVKELFIKQGDLIQIDTDSKVVMLNEEPILDKKTFGSDYFNVDSGKSELIIFPQGVFDTTVKWHDRFL